MIPELHVGILAGGKSSRMGRDKRFIEIDGESLLRRALRLSESLTERCRVHVCGEVPGLSSLGDAVSGLGPLSGVLSAVREARRLSGGAEAILVVIPVDMPGLTSEPLMRGALRLLEEPRLQAVRFHELTLPFLVRCSEAVELAVRESLQGGRTSRERSIGRLLEELAAVELDAEWGSEAARANLNTPEELAVFVREMP